ncbi:ABC transporter ATP-binding protein/permease [Paracoccaceae bacterium]|nr:ABC transporter ATP-binding protein/permease [Paracoccaceae bacterium]
MPNQFFSDADKSNLKWFWRNYMRARAKWLVLVMLLIIFQGFVYQQFLVLTESGLRVIFASGTFSELIWVCLAILLIFSVRGFTSFIIPTISAKLSTSALFELRRDLTNHILHLPQSYFDKTSSGDLILRLVNQVQELSLFVGQTTVKAMRDGATVLIVSSYLIYKNIYLFSIALVVIPLIAFLMIAVVKRVRKLQALAEKSIGKFISNIDEMKYGMRTTKMAGQEEAEALRISTSAQSIRSHTYKLMRTHALTPPVIDLSSAFVYMLVVGGGGYMALSDQFDMDGASIIAFLIGLVIVFDPARNVAQFFTQLQSSLILLKSVHSIFDIETEDLKFGQINEDNLNPISIKFENVNFNYNSASETLKNISMHFKPGTKSAIVGSTGSGKTTVLSLIGRLYDINSGTISFNDDDISKLSISSVRGQITIVSQDIVIFDQSLEDNIRYADPLATKEMISEAAKKAKIDKLLLERKESPVGPNGSQLSGGQKQRIALARAFLKPAPILLLDEATSALDAVTEANISKSLDKLSENTTTIVVAHKLSSIEDADIIFVLDEGNLVEVGTHSELMKRKKHYAKMVNTQNKNNK